MKTRKAIIEDAVRIAEIHVASWRSVYKGLLPKKLLASLSIKKSSEWWNQVISEKRSDCFVLEDFDEIIGFAALGPPLDEEIQEKEGEVELQAIYLTPTYYGLGKGTDFWRSIEKTLNVDAIALWVLEKNVLGRRFYEKNHFLVERDEKKDFEFEEQRFIEIRYRKEYPTK